MAAKTKQKSLARRVAYLEKKQWQSKPEMKIITQTAANSALAAATIRVLPCGNPVSGTDVNERVGNKIRIHGVEVFGNLGDFRCDVYILLAPSGYLAQPQYSDFQAVVGGHIQANQQREFKTLKHFLQPDGANANFHVKHNFKYPMVVEFQGAGSTAASRNQLYVVVKNDTGSGHNVQFGVRTWYSDA